MKKKVIAVLLASMMATSMVPVTAMAEDQPDVVSAEETQDQGFFEEETDVAGSGDKSIRRRGIPRRRFPGRC